MTSEKRLKKQRLKKRPFNENKHLNSVESQQTFSPRDTIISLTIIIIAGLLVYANTLDAPFTFDDKPNILNNPFIRVTEISIDEIRDVLSSRSKNRPVANLTFAVNYYFHQYDETGYHIVNLAIHLLNAFLVFLITRQTLNLLKFKKTWVAIPIALLWLVNPVHTQSVTYIVQRMNSMAAMFYLLAMVCYIQGRKIHREGNSSLLYPILLFTGAAFAGLFGFLSKEITATLPVMIFLYEWYFFQDLNQNWLREQARWIIAMFIIMAVIAMMYLKGNPLTELAAKYARKDFTATQRLLTEPGVILYYLSLLVYPSPDRLRIIYDILPATSLFSPFTTLLSLSALAILVAAAFLLRYKYRLMSFAITWFLFTLIIESSFIPLALAFEHRTYLPSVFPFIALTCFLFGKTTVNQALTVICIITLLFGIWTWQRNVYWTDKVAFWIDATMKTPEDPDTHHNLGEAYAEKNETEKALACYQIALEKDKNYHKSYANIGAILVRLNRPSEAIPYLKTAIRLNTNSDKAHYNMGVALNSINRTEEAEQHYHRALKLNPLFSRPYNNMGITCFKKGEAEQALTYFKKALELEPDFTEASDNLNRATHSLKKYGRTITILRQAYEEHPDDLKIAGQLAAVCLKAGMEQLAIALYEKILSVKPECKECLDALARTYWGTGHYDRAAEILEQQAQFYPETPNIFYGLACIYAKNNQKEKAVESLRKAVARGHNNLDHIRNDNALTAIRDTEYFKTLTAGGKQ